MNTLYIDIINLLFVLSMRTNGSVLSFVLVRTRWHGSTWDDTGHEGPGLMPYVTHDHNHLQNAAAK